MQAVVLPITDKFKDYADEVAAKLSAEGVRVEVDGRNEKIGYKIREAQSVDRVPYMLILGAKEAEENTVSVRNRDTAETVTMPLDDFLDMALKQNKNRE